MEARCVFPASDSPPAESVASTARDKQAETVLKMAQNLETAGKADAALAYYRRLLTDHPGTPQAQAAAERIKVLGAR